MPSSAKSLERALFRLDDRGQGVLLGSRCELPEIILWLPRQVMGQ